MKKYVEIQSSVTITVTGGLQYEDVTNPDAHVQDRLKVNPNWPKMTCLIKKGKAWYPSEVAEWSTVKALANDGVLTVGRDSDEPNGDTAEKAVEIKTKLNQEIIAEKSRKQKVIDDIKLEDAAK